MNNARVYELSPVEGVTEEHFHRHFNINVLGPLLTTQAAVKYLGEGGSIINVGSGASRITPPNSAVYTGSKGALDAITGVLARELGPKKIRVNSLLSGHFLVIHPETDLTNMSNFKRDDPYSVLSNTIRPLQHRVKSAALGMTRYQGWPLSPCWAGMGCGGGLMCHRYVAVPDGPSVPTTSRSIDPGVTKYPQTRR